MAKGEKKINEEVKWIPKESEIAFLPHEELKAATRMAVCAYCGDPIEQVQSVQVKWTPCTCLDALKHYVWSLEPEYMGRQLRKLDTDVRNGANQSNVGILPVPLVHRKVLLKFMEGAIYEKVIAPRM